MGTRDRIVDALETLERWLHKLPAPAREAVSHALGPLRTVLLELPVPAIAVVGGTRADRVALGALLAGGDDAPWAHDDDGWWTVTGPRGPVRLWDHDGAPDPTDPSTAPLDRVRPDALLVLPGADPDAAHVLLEVIAARHEAEVPALGVLGELGPGGGIARVVEARAWRRALEDAGFAGVEVVDPIAPGGGDALIGGLMGRMSDKRALSLLRLSGRRPLVEARARSLVTATATAASAVAATPLPVADTVPLTALQLVMVLGIARLAGRPADLSAARELMGAAGLQLGGAVAFRETARALAKLVPGWGSVVSASIAYAGTAAIGEAAVAWFVLAAPQTGVRKLLGRRP